MKPSCALYSVQGEEGTPRIGIRVDAQGHTVCLTKLDNVEEKEFHIPIDIASKVAEAIHNGLALVYDKPGIVVETGSTQEAALLSAFARDHQASHDPNIGYAIRHDHKDLFYTDTSEQTRICEGTKPVAKIFQTQYAAQMATQGMKHATAVVELPVYHVVTIKESPQAQPMYYTPAKTFEYGPFSRAAKLSAEEARQVVATVPHKAFSIERYAA